MQVYYEVNEGRLDLVLTVRRDIPSRWGNTEIHTRELLDVFLEKRHFGEDNKGLGLGKLDKKKENRRDRLFLSKQHNHIYTREGRYTKYTLSDILDFLKEANITYREGIPDYIKEAIEKYGN